MAFKGKLAEFSMVQILTLISVAKKTGTLHLYVPGNKEKAGEERATFAFKNGSLTLASAGNQGLAAMLQKADKLNAAQVRTIHERGARYSDQALALILINASYVTRDDIVNSIRHYILGIVYDAMTWTQESFVFEEAVLPPPERITVSINLKDVIREGACHAQEIRLLEATVPSLDMALKLPDVPGDRFRGIHLNVEEWHVVSFINSRNTIRQIATACNMTDMEIRRVVSGLLRAGLVELAVPTVPAKPSTARRFASVMSLLSL